MRNNITNGSRVSLRREALDLSYIQYRSHYTNMYEGKTGTVIGRTADSSKLAIQFDDIVFNKHRERLSSHDTGCHGKGKPHYCWYIPYEMVDLIEDKNLLLLL